MRDLKAFWGAAAVFGAFCLLAYGCGQGDEGAQGPRLKVSSVPEGFALVDHAAQALEAALQTGLRKEIQAAIFQIAEATIALDDVAFDEIQTEGHGGRYGARPSNLPTTDEWTRLRRAVEAVMDSGLGFVGAVGGRADVEATRKELGEFKKVLAEIRSAYKEGFQREVLVKQVIRALSEYRGENWEQAAAIVQELHQSRIDFQAGWFAEKGWSYDSRQRVLVKPLSLLPDEHRWLVVQLSRSHSGRVKVESIRELGEMLQRE